MRVVERAELDQPDLHHFLLHFIYQAPLVFKNDLKAAFYRFECGVY